MEVWLSSGEENSGSGPQSTKVPTTQWSPCDLFFSQSLNQPLEWAIGRNQLSVRSVLGSAESIGFGVIQTWI